MALLTAISLTVWIIEAQIAPPVPVPGVKLGLANLVVVIALYKGGINAAFPIAVIRILLAGLTFGNTNSLLYSLGGGILSLLIMWAVKNTKLSVIGVSILGGVFHNIGQISVAALMMGTTRIAYYLPVLLIAGLVTGFLIGTASKLIIERLPKTEEIK